MREGTKFVGTEQELNNAIRKYLPKFIINDGWLDKIEEEVSEQEFTNICESIAEGIIRGYIVEKVNVQYLMNGEISFYHVNSSGSDKPQPYTLSELGKQFLGL